MPTTARRGPMVRSASGRGSHVTDRPLGPRAAGGGVGPRMDTRLDGVGHNGPVGSGRGGRAPAVCRHDPEPLHKRAPAGLPCRPHARPRVPRRRPVRPPRQRRGRAARLAQPPPPGLLRRRRVRHAQPRPVRPRAGGSLHPPRHRVAAVHAGPPRHPVRRPRLPVEAVGVDRAVGAAADPGARPGGGHVDARDRPSPPVRDRRRELPHRLLRLGLPAGPRGRSLAHPPRSRRGSAPRRAPPRPATGGGSAPGGSSAAGSAAATTAPAPGSAPRRTTRARRRWRPPPTGCATRPPRTTGSCCSSTSSTPTSRSTPPSRGSAATRTSPGRATSSSGRPTPTGPSRRGSSPSARAGTSGPTTAPSCR